MGKDYGDDLGRQLLDAARGLGVERAVDLVLNVLFVRWMTLDAGERAVGAAAWGSVVLARSDQELADEYARVAIFSDPALGIDATARLDASALRDVVHLVDRATSRGDTEPSRLLADTFEEVLAGLSKLGKQAGEAETPAEVAQLMAALTVRPGDRVLDPACGNGTALFMAASRQHAGGISGFEVNRRTQRRAAMRLLINDVGSGSGFGASPGDAFLEYERGGADAVLAQPPWGASLQPSQQAVALELAARWSVPAGTRLGGDAAWLLLALDAMAADTGRAAIVLPASSSGPRQRRLWDCLVRLGVVEAVIALPAGMFANTGVATVLWVLRGSAVRVPGESVLMIDATSFTRPSGTGSSVVLMETSVHGLADLVSRWRRGAPLEVSPSLARAVPLTELVGIQDLSPSRFLDAVPEDPVVHPEPERRLLTRVGLKRFKAFGESTAVALAPLTLLYGPNSAGKSSVIQALLLLKQSRENSRLVTQGPLVNVGSYRGVVHGHADTGLEISLTYGALPQWLSTAGTPDPGLQRSVKWAFASDATGQAWPREATLSFGEYQMDFAKADPESDTFALDLEQAAVVFQGLAAGRLSYPFDQRLNVPDEETRKRRERQQRGNARRALSALRRAGAETIEVRARGLMPSSERVDNLPAVQLSDRDSWFASSFAQRSAALAGGIADEVSSLLAEFVWLGPLRSAPLRVYDRATTARGVGDGADVALYLFDHASIVEQVNHWMARLEIPYTLEVVPIATGEVARLVGDLVAVSLTDTRTGVVVTPADVGYGISQVLPIVVELISRRDSVVAIEQPETHLHPRLQARLADLFIDSAQAGGRGNQVIVETHSEHMMLRVQRRIREGALEAKDVSVIYIDRGQRGPATVRQLRLSDDGEFLDQWPGGFFEERLDEIFANI